MHKYIRPLLFLSIAVLLSSCATSGSAQTSGQGAVLSTPAPQDSDTPAVPVADELPTSAPLPTPDSSTVGTGPVKVVWWHISTAENARVDWEERARAYAEQHPEVSIEIIVLENDVFKARLAAAMQAGSPPDIFQTWGGGVLRQYAEAGLVQNLTPALAEDGWGESFHLGPLSLYTFDGQTYGIPWDSGMVGFWYNKALFKQAGITQPPATWTEFLGVVKQLKAAGITPIALGEKDRWPGHYYWVYLATRIGGQAAFERAYSREGSFADQPFVDAGVRLRELIDLQPFQPGYLEDSYVDQQVLMANGMAAMELMGQWAPTNNRAVATHVETYNQNLGFFPFPVVEGTVGHPFDVLGGGDGFAIGKNAPSEAIDFVRFLTSVETQTDMARAGLAVPPVVKGAAFALEDPLLQEILVRVGSATYYQLYYDQYLPPAVGRTVNDSTHALFAGAATPEQVARMIEDSAAAEMTP